jgi:membrane fusion protein (multidrug efflux system)
MKTDKYIIIGLLPLALLAASCGTKQQAAVVERTTAVRVQVIQPTNEDVVRSFTGSLEGERQAFLYAKLAEAVDKIHVREGAAVKAEQTIISLDKFGPSSRYNEAKSVVANAEKTINKMDYLFKEGAISESQHDEARTAYEVAKANFDAAARLVDITSPISGTVTKIDVSAGDFVQAGQRLATVATVDHLRIKFGVNADVMDYFKAGVEVTVTSDLVSQTGHGKVVSVSESADPVTRAFQVEALIDNADGNFRPGMFVKVNVIQAHLENVLAIPRSAVVSLEDKNVVFIAANGVASRREVTLGQDLDGRIIIDSGIQAGDSLVTLGQTYLEDGSRITISSAGEAGK